ncbi:hypothetical protein [Saccharothrix sp. NRRL B-16314]|uniref:hypothetical protein n=1 Tax=Saccharothrix sp. NRRL B-16314 TaxID=1463825 RepID=UPI0012DDA779|nr:hypothetical protein [Saccharothrix sp. NRRL B-16314]
MTAEPGLSTAEYHHLALLGQLVTDAATEHRHTAITVAVDHITQYRDHATWADIAAALGITTCLRECVNGARIWDLARFP